MSSPFPPRPNLENLRKQAKRLHRQLKAGEAKAVARVRRGLPRLSQVPEAEIPESSVTLQEAQHVLAVEYGCAHWKELLAHTGDIRPMERKPLRHQIQIRVSLEGLAWEANQLLWMVTHGEGWGVPRIMKKLPRLAGVSEEDVPNAGVTLEEARQVVAVDYGYADWAELEADLGQLPPVRQFEDLTELEDEEIRRLIFRFGRDRLAVALKAATDRLKDRFQTNTSEAEWQALTDAMEELGPMPLSWVQEVQNEILKHYRTEDTFV